VQRTGGLRLCVCFNTRSTFRGVLVAWPLHDIGMANIVQRMAYERGNGEESVIAQ